MTILKIDVGGGNMSVIKMNVTKILMLTITIVVMISVDHDAADDDNFVDEGADREDDD